jgi:hypothetical protein
MMYVNETGHLVDVKLVCLDEFTSKFGHFPRGSGKDQGWWTGRGTQLIVEA